MEGEQVTVDLPGLPLIPKFRYATIGAVLMSPKVVDGIRAGTGFWTSGHTYQVFALDVEIVHQFISPKGHALTCAAALAVQGVIESEDLLANIRVQGGYLGTRCSSPSLTAYQNAFDRATIAARSSRPQHTRSTFHV